MPSRPVAIGWSVNAVRGASDNGKDKIDQQIEKVRKIPYCFFLKYSHELTLFRNYWNGKYESR